MATQHSLSPVPSSNRYSSASSYSSSGSSLHARPGGTNTGTSFPRKLTLVANASSYRPIPTIAPASAPSPTSPPSPPPAPSPPSSPPPPTPSSPRTPPAYNSPLFGRTRTARTNLPRQLTLVPREGRPTPISYSPYLPIPSSPTLIDTPRSPQPQTPLRQFALNAAPPSPAPNRYVPTSFLAHASERPPSPVKSNKRSSTTSKKPALSRRLGGGITPLGPSFLVGLAALLSIFFIISVSMVFVGAADEEDPFKELLDNAAQNNPGVSTLSCSEPG